MVAMKLIAAGLVKEVKAKAGTPVWRRDEQTGQPYALKLTAAGAKAIAVNPDDDAEPAREEQRLGIEVDRSSTVARPDPAAAGAVDAPGADALAMPRAPRVGTKLAELHPLEGHGGLTFRQMPPVPRSWSFAEPSGCWRRRRCVGTGRRRSALSPRPRRYWRCCPPTSSPRFQASTRPSRSRWRESGRRRRRRLVGAASAILLGTKQMLAWEFPPNLGRKLEIASLRPWRQRGWRSSASANTSPPSRRCRPSSSKRALTPPTRLSRRRPARGSPGV